MRNFDDVQQYFIARQIEAIGLPSNTVKIYQGAIFPAPDDNALWELLDQLPSSGVIQYNNQGSFFENYSILVNALVASPNILDPIAAAQRNLTNWGEQPPAWEKGYRSMEKQLSSAPKISFEFELPVSASSSFWGIWHNSDPMTGLSSAIALSALSVKVSFGHLLHFTPQPDDWYTGIALKMAYQNPNKTPPWQPDDLISWDSMFGITGSLHQLVTGLICVSDIKVEYTISAHFTDQHLNEIKEYNGGGVWPYYLSNKNAVTKFQINTDGDLHVSIISTKGMPIIIGVIANPMASWIGGQ